MKYKKSGKMPICTASITLVAFPLTWASLVASRRLEGRPRDPFVVHIVVSGTGFHRFGYRSALLPLRTLNGKDKIDQFLTST